MTRHSLKAILEKIDCDYQIIGNIEDRYVDKITTPNQADHHSMVFISPTRVDKQSLFENTKACVVICDSILNISSASDKCAIIVADPKLVFAKLGNHFFINKPATEIHATAIIHPEAEIGENVSIGPYSIIGKCKIGAHSLIRGHCQLYDDVILGERVIINTGCVLGADGVGAIKNTDGNYVAFPHVGRVIIESDVEIGSHSCVAKGALCDTVVRSGTIIDTFVQIGHNVMIEENVMILSNSVVAGSCLIKKNALIAIGAHICDYVSIGERAHIGPGAVIMKDVPPDAKVVPKMPMTILSKDVEVT